MKWVMLDPKAITAHIVPTDVAVIYPAVCGRRPMAGRAWVDAKATFTACSRCTLSLDRRGIPRPPRSA